MNRSIVLSPEVAYQRSVLFALEVLDSVTLERLTRGLTVTAVGLKGDVHVNASGLFVWLQEDPDALQMISIDPGLLPFEALQLPAAQVEMPFKSVELAPACSYPFAAGMTGLCGTLIEDRVAAPDVAQPVTNAQVRLVWLADDGVTWNDAPTHSHTNAHGDFAVVIRFAPTDVPHVDANGNLSVQMRVARSDQVEQSTGVFLLQQGRVATSQNYPQQGGAPEGLVFAWSELHA